MAYKRRREERGQEWEQRNASAFLYPIKEFSGILVRMSAKDAGLRSVYKEWTDKRGGLLAKCVVRKDDEEYFDLIKLADLGGDTSSAEAESAREFRKILDDDLTLSGGRSESLLRFREIRKKIHDENRDAVRGYCEKSVDFHDEMCDGKHPVEDSELKESYLAVQNCLQEIVTKLFKSAGLEITPKVHLTKSDAVNAFILSGDKGKLLKNYLETGSGKKIVLPIFINLGMIKSMKSVDEVAGILAHEFSHLLQPNYFQENKSNKDSQRLEYDADAEGMKIADAAGYNPRGLISAFKTLGKQEVSSLSIIFGGTHPPTANRIVELEKLFNQPDLPLPNGAKKFRSFPPEVQAALKIIETKKERPERRAIGLNSDQLKDLGNLNEKMREERGLEYLDTYAQAEVERKGTQALKDEFFRQEFAHGATGHRAQFLENLHGFMLAMQAAEKFKLLTEQKGGEVSVHIKMRDLRSANDAITGQRMIGDVSDSELVIEPEVKWAGSPDELKKAGADPHVTDAILNKRKSLVGDNDLVEKKLTVADFDQWLDDSEYTKPFWDYISTQFNYKKALSRAQKLFCLKELFSNYLFSHYSDLWGVNADEKGERTVKTKIKVPKDAGKTKLAILDHVPLAGRVHKKKTEVEEEEIEIDEKVATYKRKVFDFESRTDFYLKFNVWKKPPSECPPLVRETAELLEERTTEAYRELLKKEGLENISDAALIFVLSHLCINPQTEPQITDISFSRQDKVDIKFLDEVIRILECKNLSKIFSGGGDLPLIKQRQLRDRVLGFVAFGIETDDEEEKKIQVGYLKRFELDPTKPQQVSTSIKLKEGCRAKLNKGRVIDRADNWKDFTVLNTGLSATDERIWLESGKQLAESIGKDNDGEQLGKLSETEVVRRLVSFFEIGELKSAVEKRKLRGLAKKVLSFTDKLAKHLNHVFESGVLTQESLSNLFKEERNFLTNNDFTKQIYFLSRIVEKAGGLLQKDFSSIQNGKSAEKFLWQIFRATYDLPATIKRTQLVRGLDFGADQSRVYSETQTDATVSADAEVWLNHRPRKDELENNNHNFPYTSTENVLAVLDSSSKPGAKELKDFIIEKFSKKYSEGSQIYKIIKDVSLGHFISFRQFSDEKHDNFREIIDFWRKVSVVYKDDWQNLEGFKKLDEQMSVWEWQYLNPVGLETSVVKKYSIVGKTESVEKRVAWSAYLFFNYRSELANIYQCDITKLDAVVFSWPLFLQDVWEGRAVVSILDEAKELDPWKVTDDIERFRVDLQRVVDDPNNLEQIFKMQPGFFKEFILDKKMKKLGVLTLEEVEEWMKNFTSYSHEGSERNQISAQIEKAKAEKKSWERKRDFFLTALGQTGAQVVSQQEVRGSWSQGNVLELKITLNGEEVKFKVGDKLGKGSFSSSYLSSYNNKPMPFYALAGGGLVIYEVEVWRLNHNDQLVNTHLSLCHFDGRIGLNGKYTGLRVSDNRQAKDFCKFQMELLTKYDQLVSQAEQGLSGSVLAKESEVLVFSDEVVENDKSKLEIGPTYKLRWLSQPLMDWHTQALGEADSLADLEKLYSRVEQDLPEKHPLRDLFVKNQLYREIWQVLKDSLGEDELKKLGVNLQETEVDLEKALEHFPIYKKISFLKKYKLIGIENLSKAVEKLSPEQAWTIRHKLEQAVTERISPDQRVAMRRVLMEIEKVTLWPELKEGLAADPGMFDEYLHRIKNLYPEATWERDDILESIGMDLAQTPEQIKAVWNLRYSEEVKWPKEDETKIVAKQFSTIEKFRFYISQLNPPERAHYLVWMLGGDQPFSEKFSVEQTGISLEERADVLWGMTPTERRHLLYDLMLGENGIMEAKDGSDYLDDDTPDENIEKIFPWPMWERENDLVRYATDKVFDLVFKEERIDDSLPSDHKTNTRGKELLKTIFRELFVQQKEPARRAELMVNIIEAIEKTKRTGKEMSAGELIRTLLEQIGVVGIKAGQLLSEQPDLLPEKIRKELSQLKDKTTPFSKRGVLTYLESTDLLTEKPDGIKKIGEIVGSASIKEVVKGVTNSGEIVAIKAKRPSIDKNFAEDMNVLRRVLKIVERKGFSVPGYLLDEVERMVSDELSFVNETDNQRAMGVSLKERGASIDLSFGDGNTETISLSVSAPLKTSEVSFPASGETEDVGLMVEEFVKGLSLKEIQEWQQAVAVDDKSALVKMRKKLKEMYGARGIKDVEKRLTDLDLSKLQGQLALELLREVSRGGIFHSDLHSGNFYLDVVPLLKAKATFIDLGSVGCSSAEAMPEHLKKDYPEKYDVRSEFKGFLTAFFGLEIQPERCLTRLVEVVNKFGGVDWDVEKVKSLIQGEEDIKRKVNKIFYALLESGGAKMEKQFRYLLKAVATAADHLDKLKSLVMAELMTLDEKTAGKLLAGKMTDEELQARHLTFIGKIRNEELIDLDLLGLK